MKLRAPAADQVTDLAASLHMELSHEEAMAYAQMISGMLDAYQEVDEAPEALPDVRFPRTPGFKPQSQSNPLGAWARILEVRGRDDGPLAGRTVALKDTILLSGVPMSAGTRFLDGYVPEIDATVVTRVLAGGAVITGKTVCEYLCVSGGSHTSFPVPVRNPWRASHSSGGSSSGAAVVVATGEADMALGTDQGGSIRIPAAWCGIVGLKPTYGLVPYTGILPLEHTLDHVGPLSRTVRDNALLLSAIAGFDPLDARQHPGVRRQDYVSSIDAGIRGLRLGILREGFGFQNSEPAVDTLVRDEAARLERLGATVEEVSIPIHRRARSLWTPLFVEGFRQLMVNTHGAGTNHRGLYLTSVSDAFSRWQRHADELSPTVKAVLLAAAHMHRTYRGRFYGRSQNLMRDVRSHYDQALERYALLIMPTTPTKAQPLPSADPSPGESWNAALGMNTNTAPFCSTGHPAISLPCGMVDGLPVGMMLVGRHGEEGTLYRAAFAYEQERNGFPRLEATDTPSM